MYDVGDNFVIFTHIVLPVIFAAGKYQDTNMMIPRHVNLSRLQGLTTNYMGRT